MSEQNTPDAEESTTEESTTGDASEGAGEAAETDGSDAGPSDADTEAANAESDSREVDEALVDRIAESDPEDLARELASLRTQIDGLEAQVEAKESEIEELTSKLKRKQADFQNFKKRMEKRREEERERATEDLVTRLVDVRDNLVRALDQDEDTDIRGGVESTLRQFDDVLEAENVEAIEPEPGEDVDPHRHEVLVRVDSDQPEGTIADVHQPGYLMADSVLREAQVTVSDGSEE